MNTRPTQEASRAVPAVRPRHAVEYALLKGVSGLVNLLPYRTALAAGCVLARIAFLTARSRVNEAKRRLTSVFGDTLTERRKDSIAWTAWRNLCFHGIEMMRMHHISQAWIDAHTDDYTASLETLTSAVKDGQGAVLACPHMGNWELAGLVCRLQGFRLFSVAGKQRNPLVNAYLADLRNAAGIEVLERGSDTMRRAIRRLQAGDVLALLPDVRVRRKGLPTPFLGGTAWIGPGMAFFARAAGVPVIPCFVTRRGWSRHVMATSTPIAPDPTLNKQEDMQRITTQVLARVDDAIRRQPEQWFWYNRRWILDQPEE